ncbi:MAG TPA: DNA polymerase Y family protein, partial [Parasegetibacter sp.]
LRHPELRTVPFVVIAPSHGRQIITAANALAETEGIRTGMTLADARIFLPRLIYLDEQPDLAPKLLHRIAEWCIRFTPVASVDLSDGIILDATGCSHLWGGDTYYIRAIARKFKERGYDVRIGMAGTIGAAWALARYGEKSLIIENGNEFNALLPLPPEALRLHSETVASLYKLGLKQVGQFINMPRESLRRRFGQEFLIRLDQALGREDELIQPVHPEEPYSERLHSIDGVKRAKDIATALQTLLEQICLRLRREEKGLRVACLRCFRVDGKIIPVEIHTAYPSSNEKHLFKLFEKKIETIDPDLGIELFILDAKNIEDHSPSQSAIWNDDSGLNDTRLTELIDRLTVRLGKKSVHRFLPAEHYWPERSVKRASLQDEKTTDWNTHLRRPVWLQQPELIQVTAPVPDYPPMNFRYKNKLHVIKKAEGPERVEQEWWQQTGMHRDYYIVEDEEAGRYWIFRSGHYDHNRKEQWFLHGFFA